jgi:hypothetical protein
MRHIRSNCKQASYDFTSEEHTDMHFVYGFSNDNTTAAIEEYWQQFPGRQIPN